MLSRSCIDSLLKALRRCVYIDEEGGDVHVKFFDAMSRAVERTATEEGEDVAGGGVTTRAAGHEYASMIDVPCTVQWNTISSVFDISTAGMACADSAGMIAATSVCVNAQQKLAFCGDTDGVLRVFSYPTAPQGAEWVTYNVCACVRWMLAGYLCSQVHGHGGFVAACTADREHVCTLGASDCSLLVWKIVTL
jgi:hypothetical protein